MKGLLTLYTIFISTLALVGQEASSELGDQERALYQKFQSQFEECSAAGLNGDLKSSNQKMVELAEKNPSPAMNLLVGNMLYPIDRDASYKLHKKAFDA